MEKRIISHTTLEIAPINFGGNVFGWTLDEQQSFDILDAFADAGFNFIDSADTYPWWVNGTGGTSEEIIGKWMKKKRNRQKMVIATKVGSHNKVHDYDISRKHILKSVDESLQRLQTDVIDLYYTHFDDKKTAVEETMATYDEIVKAGKVRYVAASNLSPERLQASFDICAKEGFTKYVALQPHYNLVQRNTFETQYLPLVKEYGLSVFPYWSLAAGFLTGKYRTQDDLSKSARGAGIAKYLNEDGLSVLSALDTVCKKHHSTQATVALAWLLAQPQVTAPIVSATSRKQLDNIIAAPQLRLDAEDMRLLNQASLPAE